MWLSQHNPSDILKNPFIILLKLVLLFVPYGIVHGGYCHENLCRNFHVLVY